jgi:hypothetical protein
MAGLRFAQADLMSETTSCRLAMEANVCHAGSRLRTSGGRTASCATGFREALPWRQQS